MKGIIRYRRFSVSWSKWTRRGLHRQRSLDDACRAGRFRDREGGIGRDPLENRCLALLEGNGAREDLFERHQR